MSTDKNLGEDMVLAGEIVSSGCRLRLKNGSAQAL